MGAVEFIDILKTCDLTAYEYIIVNGICALRVLSLTAFGGKAKTPPKAVKHLSVGHSFR